MTLDIERCVAPYNGMGNIETLCGDSLVEFATVRGLQAIVQDPPAGIAFMGRQWDKDHGGRDGWIRKMTPIFRVGREACERGAYSLTWALPKTSHWTASAVEDAGWEIVDVITHVFGQGMPKHKNTLLKPASEHWILARNGMGGALQIGETRVERGVRMAPATTHWSDHQDPHSAVTCGPKEPTSAGSFPTNLILSHAPECEEHGTRTVRGSAPASGPTLTGESRAVTRGKMSGVASTPSYGTTQTVSAFRCLAHCESCAAHALHPSGGAPPRCACGEAMAWACPVAEMDAQSGVLTSGIATKGQAETTANAYGKYSQRSTVSHGDSGGASRFFPTFHYAGKCPSSERHAGCEHMLWERDEKRPFGYARITSSRFAALPEERRARGNVHPTVKRLKLMRHHVKLVTPKGGRVGDLFMGSGSTGIAAALEGRSAIGCDMSHEAVEIARARIAHWTGQGFALRALAAE